MTSLLQVTLHALAFEGLLQGALAWTGREPPLALLVTSEPSLAGASNKAERATARHGGSDDSRDSAFAENRKRVAVACCAATAAAFHFHRPRLRQLEAQPATNRAGASVEQASSSSSAAAGLAEQSTVQVEAAEADPDVDAQPGSAELAARTRSFEGEGLANLPSTSTATFSDSARDRAASRLRLPAARTSAFAPPASALSAPPCLWPRQGAPGAVGSTSAAPSRFLRDAVDMTERDDTEMSALLGVGWNLPPY